MLDLCTKYVTEENAEELVDRLVECVKRGVGMPTRVGYENERGRRREGEERSTSEKLRNWFLFV